jgi:Domain of unknown function (DUF5666)
MQRVLLGVTFAVLSMISWSAPYALAEDMKIARGTVVDMGGNWLTIKVRDQQMKFAVDTKTMVEARGGSTKTREAAASGRPGPKLTDVLRIGQGVAVTYHELNGSPYASHVRVVTSVSEGGAATSSEPESLLSSGTVQSVGANSITISGGGGGGASFTQTFMIDERTKVYAKGAGTAAAAQGGRMPFSQLIGSGDKVSISYHKTDGALHASDVRVTLKAMH